MRITLLLGIGYYPELPDGFKQREAALSSFFVGKDHGVRGWQRGAVAPVSHLSSSVPHHLNPQGAPNTTPIPSSLDEGGAIGKVSPIVCPRQR